MAQDYIFDGEKLRLALRRAGRIATIWGAHHHGFLHREAASILGERLAATKRTFRSPAILFDGPFSRLVEETILQNNPPIDGTFRHVPLPQDDTHPVLDVEPESLDLIVSVFDLHRINDLAMMMVQINFALKPDGLFLGVLPTKGTLRELQSSIIRAELEHNSGSAMRIDLFPEIRQLGDLLQNSGFKLPVCDTEERIIRYGAMSGLLKDLRGTGASLAFNNRYPPLNRRIMAKLEELYRKEFSDPDGRLRASFNMAFLSGWKEDKSQQKPLRPGSASHNLKDFL